MWPLVWLIALFIGVFYSAAHSLLAGSRHLSMVYMVGLSCLLGSGVLSLGRVIHQSPHAKAGQAVQC